MDFNIESGFFWHWCFLGSGEMSHRNQSSEFRGNLDGCFGVAYGKKSLEEIFLKKLLRKKYFFAMIYMLAQIITKKTSNYCRLLILRYLLQMEVYSPLYILHLHFLGQMKILHDLLVWLYQSLEVYMCQ